MHTHTFSIFLYYFLFFLLIVFGVGPSSTNMGWAHMRHAWSKSRVHGLCCLIQNRRRKWINEKQGKQSKRLTWFFYREFARDCWGRRFCLRISSYSFCLYLTLYSFSVSLFQLIFFRFFTLFSEQRLYSLWAGFLSRFS